MAAGCEKIWRYLDLARFISLLSTESLRFACPNEFTNDPYEGYYPKSHVQAFSSMAKQQLGQLRATRDEMIARLPGIDAARLDEAIVAAKERFKNAFNETRLKFGISCWHRNEAESEAMWKLYATSGQGIAIESTRNQLRDSLSGSDGIHIGDVRYLDFESDPIEKGHEHYGLFLKRKSFEHERELRATILLNSAGQGMFVKCDLNTLITQIHISPFAPAYFKDVVSAVCSGALRQLHKPVCQSPLLALPSQGYGLDVD